MSLFSMFEKSDINRGVEEFRSAENAVLLDVRTREEYSEGHIDGSINIALSELDEVLTTVPDKDTPIFVHCRSGARSAQATQQLKDYGYTSVKNIGGVLGYKGGLV